MADYIEQRRSDAFAAIAAHAMAPGAAPLKQRLSLYNPGRNTTGLRLGATGSDGGQHGQTHQPRRQFQRQNRSTQSATPQKPRARRNPQQLLDTGGEFLIELLVEFTAGRRGKAGMHRPHLAIAADKDRRGPCVEMVELRHLFP
ncbi:hypothetical protein E4T56_gene13842, partial [Termitomyces sp. T112]